jgi:hypothetical protein
MSDRSPFFISAAELLAHAVELFRQIDERKYKFIILHLANAVELILQDRLIDAGQSIYEPGKPVTISIWKVLEALGKIRVKLPERPMIDLLIEDRGTVQHRLGYPELKTVYGFLDDVTAFFKRFLREEYGVELVSVLNGLNVPEEDLQLLGVLEGQKNEIALLEKLFELSPESSILQAFTFVESKLSELFFIQQGYLELKTRRPFLLAAQRSPELERLLEGLVEDGFLPQELVDRLEVLRTARNFAAYHDTTRRRKHPDWIEALDIAKDVLTGLNHAIEVGYGADTEKLIPVDLESEDENL